MAPHAFSPTKIALLAVSAFTMVTATGAAEMQLLPDVLAEEQVYTFEPAENGSGPLWCRGSTCLARTGDSVFVSGLETLKDVKPLCNVRWLLFKRSDGQWALQQADPNDRQREPCPLACFPDGRILLSVNPNRAAPDARSGPAEPQVLQFSAAEPTAPCTTLLPVWDDGHRFTEHSYRAFCVDGPNEEALLLNVMGHDAQYWSFLDRDGNWSRHGRLTFPMGHDYEKPEPIRLCYPVVALRDRAAHVLAISDIIEPVKAWREYKLVLNKGRKWDYDFRRLFYTWTPDITTVPFSPWIEVASREKTAGYIANLDLWVDAKGRTHLLWQEQSVWNPKVRDKFFPDMPITTALMHGIVDQGNVVRRTTLAEGGEGLSAEVPGWARLHATPDGRLFAFYHCRGKDAAGRNVAENRLIEIMQNGTASPAMRVPLAHPFTSFMTATERGGSPPSNVLEVLGVADGRPGMSYAAIELFSRIRADAAFTVRRSSSGSTVECDATDSSSVAGKVVSWDWALDDTKAAGAKVTRTFKRSGPIAVTLTVKDDKGNEKSISRSVDLALAPGDMGLESWGLPLRTEAETYVGEDGGTMHLRTDKLGASALSLSHWNTNGHWLEWDVDIPMAGKHYLLIRYACPTDATRALAIDGREHGTMHFPLSGGYGSAHADDWSLAVLRDSSGKPKPLQLSAGAHRVSLRNTDGTGLNLDYLEWVAEPREGAPCPPAGRVIHDADYSYVIPLRGAICPTRIRAELGHCYMVTLGPHFPGDGTGAPTPSALRMFEDDRELIPAHAPHVDIRDKGKGSFSHWDTTLRFSATDNSDPRTNGRTYTWRIAPQTD